MLNRKLLLNLVCNRWKQPLATIVIAISDSNRYFLLKLAAMMVTLIMDLVHRISLLLRCHLLNLLLDRTERHFLS